MEVSPPPVPQAILKRLGPVPLRDLPEEWHGDLARMYEVVSKDALAFVNLTDKIGRVPVVNQPEINGNGSGEGDAVDGEEPPEIAWEEPEEELSEEDTIT